MRVAVVGGGPGGLFAATLIKRSDPAREVTVFERNRAEDTFGFGVVFSDATLAGIHEADPVLLTALTEHGVHWDAIEVRLHGERHRCGGNGMAAVERRTLLALLQRQPPARGRRPLLDRGRTSTIPRRRLRPGHRRRRGQLAAPRALPRRCSARSVETATAKFIWLGTTYPFDGLTFVHERGPHGVFAVHGYPISSGGLHLHRRDRRALLAPAGLDEFDVTQPPGAERREEPRLPGAAVRRADRRPSAAGEQLPVGQLPHPARAAGGSTGPTARRSPCSVTPCTPPTSRSARAPRWPWRTPSPWPPRSTGAPRRPRRRAGRLRAGRGSRRWRRSRTRPGPSLSWWEHFGRYHDALPPLAVRLPLLLPVLTDASCAAATRTSSRATDVRWTAAHGAEPLRQRARRCAGRAGPAAWSRR